MNRADITSGLAFKTSLRVATAFILLLVVAGSVLVAAVTNTLRNDLHTQNEEQIVLLTRIYDAEGRDGIINAVASLSNRTNSSDQPAGLFDRDGLRLAGSMASPPPVVGLEKTHIQYIEQVQVAATYFVKSVSIDDLTLFVARSSRIVDEARWWLIFWLALLGSSLTITTLGLGYLASRKSLLKLQAMEDVLQDVSRGNLAARLAVSHDNDQIDRISKQVNRHIGRLAHLMERLQSTATAIAHDLKTPLSDAQISLHQALDSLQDGQDASDRIESAQTDLQKLNSIFETILRISHIEAGQGKAVFEDVDLSTIAVEMVEFLQPLADETGTHLEIGAGLQSPVALHADSGMIQQLLANLIGNAITHCPAGCRVKINAQSVSAGIQLSVEDNGPGIPSEERKRVLQPFVRLDSARTSPGSGLGLALVVAISDHHRARLELKDAAPGLRVEIVFPKL